MTGIRAKALDLIQGDSIPWGQHWGCKTTWPLADVLNDQFFIDHRGWLYAGASVRVIRYDRNDINDRSAKVLEICDLVITESGPQATAVKFALIGPVIIMGDGPSMEAYEVKRGQSGKFKLTKGDELIQEYGSKAEADAALKQKLAA